MIISTFREMHRYHLEFLDFLIFPNFFWITVSFQSFHPDGYEGVAKHCVYAVMFYPSVCYICALYQFGKYIVKLFSFCNSSIILF